MMYRNMGSAPISGERMTWELQLGYLFTYTNALTSELRSLSDKIRQPSEVLNVYSLGMPISSLLESLQRMTV